MRDLDGSIFLSATDLMRFTGRAHATSLDLAHMCGTGPEWGDDTEDAALLQKQGHGIAHKSDRQYPSTIARSGKPQKLMAGMPINGASGYSFNEAGAGKPRKLPAIIPFEIKHRFAVGSSAPEHGRRCSLDVHIRELQ